MLAVALVQGGDRAQQVSGEFQPCVLWERLELCQRRSFAAFIHNEGAQRGKASRNEPRKPLEWRINQLIKDTMRSPFEGIGKPEPLKADLSGLWSRRITDEHRLIYRATEHELIIIACRYHYTK